jgi:hypothetical protein
MLIAARVRINRPRSAIKRRRRTIARDESSFAQSIARLNLASRKRTAIKRDRNSIDRPSNSAKLRALVDREAQ